MMTKRHPNHRDNVSSPQKMAANRTVAALFLGLLSTLSITAFAGTLTEVGNFGTNPGNLRLFAYLPDALPPASPLVVALHGCQQTAAAYGDEAGWTKFAERWQFALLLPQQQEANNGQGCFNWFQPADINRDQGEALSIRQMVDQMITTYALDPQRVYITGLSAGGAMTAVMLATYPERFAGGAILAGVPYQCASGVMSALRCQLWGRDLTPAAWGERVRQATQGVPWDKTHWPKVSIWQGDSDRWVRWVNARELIEQWTAVHQIDQQPDQEAQVKGYPHHVYTDANGQAWVEAYWLTDMGHGAPIDPGPADDQCGTPSDYILDVNLCASYYIAHFWGIHRPRLRQAD